MPFRRRRRAAGAGAGRASRAAARRGGLRAGLTAPVTALRCTARNPVLARAQLAWAAVMTASWAATVAMSVVAYNAGGSAAVALAVLARTAPNIVAGPVVGLVLDRGPRRSMRWAAVGCGAACAVAASANSWATSWANSWATSWANGLADIPANTQVVVTVVAMTAVALATMVFRGAQSAAMPELVEAPDELVASNVLSSAIESSGVFVGPALAGVLLSVQGPWLTFAVAAALSGTAAVLLGRVAGGAPRAVRSAATSPPSTRELARVASARLLLLLVVAQTTVAGGLIVLYAGLAVDFLDLGVGAVGLLTSAYGLGGVIGSLGLFSLAGSRRLGVFTAVALALWAVPLVLVPATPALAGVLALLALVGLGNILFDVTVVTLLQRAVPPHLLGRAFGSLETVVVLGLALGAVAAPLLERVLDPARALGALGAALAVVAVVGLRPLLRLDATLRAPSRQVRLLRGLPVFAGLPTPELERLALRLEQRHVAAGDVVVRQGERGERYFIVEQGQLTVSVDRRDVATLGPGKAFGEIALLRDTARTATVTARTSAELWTLEGPLFLAVLRADGGRALTAADDVMRRHLERAAPRPTGPDRPAQGGPSTDG